MLRAYVALAAFGLIWGANFIFMKWCYRTDLAHADSVPTGSVRFSAAGRHGLASGGITRDQLRHLPHFVIMSVLATSFYYYGFVAGTALLPTSVAGLLSGSIPIFTFICAWLLLREDRPPEWLPEWRSASSALR